MTTCYDAVSWRDIPADAAMVAGYLDGSWPWPQEAWDHFPNAIKVTIVVNPAHNAGDIYDCEPGNGHPHDAGPWAKMRNDAGLEHPCIYSDKADWQAIKASVSQSGATGVVYWIADPPYPNVRGNPHDIPGAVGCQYAFSTNLPPELAGRNIDVSQFNDVSWIKGHQVSPAPANAPATPAVTAPVFPGYVQRGARGSTVTDVQEQLKDRGWNIAVDGDFGPATDSIVRQFQSEKHLAVDGIVGPQTWSALFTAPGSLNL